MKIVLQKFNISGNTKSVSTLLAPLFKLKITISFISIEEREYMTHVSCVSVFSSLMYTMACIIPDMSQVVSIVNIYMHDPDRGH